WYPNPKVVFKLTAPDDLSGITGFYYTFSEDPKVIPDPKSSSFTEKNELALDIPRDGVHILSVICQDVAGNISKEVAVYRIRLDTFVDPPTLSSPSHSQQDKWNANRRVEMIWKDPMDLSGIDGFYYDLN